VKKRYLPIIVLIFGMSLLALPLALISEQPPQIVIVTVLTSVGATIVATVVSLMLGKKLKEG